MAKFTAYKVSSLPTSNIDENGLYFKKEAGDDFYTSHLRASENWVDLGIVDSVESVNGLTGDVKIDLSFSGGDLEIIATGDGTATTVATITIIDDSSSGANKTYSSDKINSLIQQAGGGDMLASMYDPTGVEGDAFDYDNFHNTPDINDPTITITNGATVLGSFSLNQEDADSINLASLTTKVEDNLTSTSSSNALSANQGRVLKDLIDNLQNVVNSGISLQGGYDAGTETELPGAGNALKGNAWYITNSGTIQGETFEPGDMLIANTDSPSTTDISDWIAIQTNIGQATESTPGHAKIATSAIALAGTNDTDIMTAKKVKEVVENISQMLETSTSIDIVNNEIRTKAVKGDVSIPANSVTSTINNGVVTYAKIQNVSSESLLGRYSSTNGTVQEVKLADNLDFDGADLTVVWGSEEW